MLCHILVAIYGTPFEVYREGLNNSALHLVSGSLAARTVRNSYFISQNRNQGFLAFGQVLELGAGSGLCSLVAARACQAKTVVSPRRSSRSYSVWWICEVISRLCLRL